MKPPRHQFTLAELMGLVAICAVAMALLMSPAWGIGFFVLLVIPGFILGRVRGGKGILGGTLSGCFIPTVLDVLGILIGYFSGELSLEQIRYRLLGLYFGFLPCLLLSFVIASVIYRLDRRLQGEQGSKEGMVGAASAGNQFLPDKDRPGLRAGASPELVIRPGAVKRRSGG